MTKKGKMNLIIKYLKIDVRNIFFKRKHQNKKESNSLDLEIRETIRFVDFTVVAMN